MVAIEEGADRLDIAERCLGGADRAALARALVAAQHGPAAALAERAHRAAAGAAQAGAMAARRL